MNPGKKNLNLINKKLLYTKNTTPSKKELRDFGLLFGTMVAILFGFIFPWIGGSPLTRIPLIFTCILWLLSFVVPVVLYPLYKVWMQIALVLGWINNRIILGFVFYGIITPMGILFRIRNRNIITLKFNINHKTYRLPSRVRTKESMEKPF